MHGSSRAMLDRAATVHRPDCPALADVPVPPAEDTCDDTWMAAEAGALLRRPYDALRRLIGQVAGLLVLAQASGERAVFDLTALRIAQDQWKEVGAGLADITASRHLHRQLEAMRGAVRLVGACLSALDSRGAGSGAPDVSVALARVSSAYQLLQTVSEPKLGLAMVDFRQSCCNCATTIRA